MALDLEKFRTEVQMNCHVSDARYARNYTLCTYLLKMREYFRWERGFDFQDTLPREELGVWLDEREDLWSRLESAELKNLSLNGVEHEPYDSGDINAVLTQHGLVYGGGYGLFAKPLFFLAEHMRVEERDGCLIHHCGRELARDLSAPPALSRGRDIYVRRQSVQRMAWEHFESWNWKKQDDAMGRFISAHTAAGHEANWLDDMTDTLVEVMVLHEIGEYRAGTMLGDAWERLLLEVSGSEAERTLRAIRDHLADTLVTLPALLQSASTPALHACFSSFDALRKSLYPRLWKAYQAWLEDDENLSGIQQSVELGARHWQTVAEHVLDAYDKGGREVVKEMLARGVSL